MELSLLARVGGVPDCAGGGGARFEDCFVEGGRLGGVAEDVMADLVDISLLPSIKRGATNMTGRREESEMIDKYSPSVHQHLSPSK